MCVCVHVHMCMIVNMYICIKIVNMYTYGYIHIKAIGHHQLSSSTASYIILGLSSLIKLKDHYIGWTGWPARTFIFTLTVLSFYICTPHMTLYMNSWDLTSCVHTCMRSTLPIKPSSKSHDFFNCWFSFGVR